MTANRFKKRFRERNARHHLLKPDEEWKMPQLIDLVDKVMS